ncbi:ACP S-malonyltransferase [Paractinoplanes lichenicola]|uniref:Malonyl CoA-acyl carrier protein transacylase n=1 Tax=Paractinoplanes lichenicola TaxID=2802976 RepID=A0ABS1VFC1_9ACTN|nr:ACP S-malonyltransferase [Actinoplanes lichenicola]MBL7253403.1 ACP S-malonyltransferase [Actinoplanes lichenicola]
MTSRNGSVSLGTPTGCLAMFPGQGSQRAGMAEYLIKAYPSARRLFARADEILGLPLSRICVSGSAEELGRTEITQPAIATTSLAVWHLLQSAGYRPAATTGHSLGEYPALVAAEVLTLESALELVRLRGRLMGEVAREVPGAMAAVVGLPADQVVAACGGAGDAGLVQIANYNEPLQTVISGHAHAVEQAGKAALEAGADRVVPLDVSAPFHCSLMNAVEEEFTAALAAQPFADPVLPVISSVTGTYVRSGEEARELLRRQLTGPVRWVEVLRTAARHPVGAYTEIGPGRVLSGLARRTLGEVRIRSTGDPRRLTAIYGALAPDQWQPALAS